MEYISIEGDRAVVFVFRDGGPFNSNTIPIRGLDPDASYSVTNMNQRPGRDKSYSGKALTEGLSVELPDPWLSCSNLNMEKLPKNEKDAFERQKTRGSDIVLVSRLNQ